MTTFYKNYVSLCAERKKSLSRVAEEVGLSRTAPNGWKKGKIPSEVTLEKLAQYFNISVETLTSNEQKKPAPEGELLDKALADASADLSGAELAEVMDFIRFVKSKRK